MKFRILWGFDALVTIVVLYFFIIGMTDGSVSSFNAGIWLVILTALGIVMLGSLKLHTSGRNQTAMILLLFLAVPGLLCALFFLIILIANPRWN